MAAGSNLTPRTWVESIPNRALLVTTGVGFGAATAYELAAGQRAAAIATALVPLMVWEFSRLAASFVLLGASLPLLKSVAGAGSPVNVAPSDLVLAFLFAGVLAAAVIDRRSRTFESIRPIRFPLGIYGLFLLVLLAFHFGGHETLQTAQRFELFFVPVVVGSFAVFARRHVQLLTAYVLATTVFAAIWPIHDFGIQKNPAGQLITNAILLLVAYRPLRRLMPTLLVLVPGLLLTQSRGAVGALIIGVIVVGLAHPARGWALLARIAPLILVVVAVFTVLSPSTQNRLTTFTSSGSTGADYSIHIRHEYTHDAKAIIAAHPWVGIGVGSYAAGEAALGTATDDPHDVVLLQAAEGGYPFAVAFVLLVAGTMFFLYRLRDIPLVPAAAAVMLATVAHGFVDVYWVRGTPVLSWLLIGMVCAQLYQRRSGPEAI